MQQAFWGVSSPTGDGTPSKSSVGICSSDLSRLNDENLSTGPSFAFIERCSITTVCTACCSVFRSLRRFSSTSAQRGDRAVRRRRGSSSESCGSLGRVCFCTESWRLIDRMGHIFCFFPCYFGGLVTILCRLDTLCQCL